MFYVAIARARKRLVVSGVSGLITKFVDSIIHHFLVRTELIIRNTESSYSGIQVLAEIGGETLRVKKIERNNVYRKDYNIKQLYKRIKNQFMVELLLNSSISVSDVFGSIEKTIHPYGGYIIDNS